ncbi:MAG: S41 family peptidase, partial [Blastocatellia bacterium]
PRVCEAGWEEFRRTLKADCDQQCQDRFYYFVQNRLSETLAVQAKALQAKQISGLIVDIAGNGGGTEWVDSVARILSAKPLKAPLQNSVRHPRDVARFERHLQLIESDLKQSNLTIEQQQYLKLAKERVTAALNEAKTAPPCDKSDIWTAPDGGRKCSSLKAAASFSSGVLDYAPRHVLNGLKAKEVLFNASIQDYQESAFTTPLYVLVDQRTASASEYFAALLQDNEAAKIIGERTWGLGCGYTDGGIKWVLPNSRLRVLIPDCVRYRKDGGNEYEGVKPDFAIWTKDDGKPARAEKLLRVLREFR